MRMLKIGRRMRMRMMKNGRKITIMRKSAERVDSRAKAT